MGGNTNPPPPEQLAAIEPQPAAPVESSKPAEESKPVVAPRPKPAPAQTQTHAQAQQPSYAQAPVATEAPLCNECARVTAVRTEERQGQASGIGVVGGAVLGGILGHQVGGGTGKKIATVGGAVAGGYAGNEIEKNSKRSRVWIVSLSNKDGSTHKHEQASDPQLQVGDVVVVRDGRLERR
jgi:outer membrane lipoprotein SlyB